MKGLRLKTQIKNAPNGPGVYLFKDAENRPLYIGKALDLKTRLKSYLKINDIRLNRMLLESDRLDFIRTDSDIEALILESQYIKKYRPEFNIMLRDNKQYSFIIFTDEEYPKIFITHQPQAEREAIGPFTDAKALKITLKHLRRIFPYCTCKQLHNNYCLNYHIGNCLGFCCLKQKNQNIKPRAQNLKLYKNNIRAIKNILNGKKNSLIKNLEKEMKYLGKEQKFEEAKELQYKTEKLKRVFQNAQIINNTKTYSPGQNTLQKLAKILSLKRLPHRIEAYDIANIQGEYATGSMIVFIDGFPDKNSYRKFNIKTVHGANDTGMLKEIITRRFNHPEWPYPDLLIVDGGKAQYNLVRSIIPLPVIAVTKNEFHVGHKIIIKRTSSSAEATTDTEELFLSKLPLDVKNLILYLDSEAHRFAISHHRKLHRKSFNKN